MNKVRIPSLNISFNDVKLEQAQKLKKLGTILNWDARNDVAIQMRIPHARKAFSDMRSFLCNKNISFTVRKYVLVVYVVSILTYNSETWTMSKIGKKLNPLEMWSIRRMQRDSCTQRKTNEHVLRTSNITRFLLKSTRKRQLNFLGHVIKKNQLEHLSLTWKIAGRKSRGRQRETYMS